MIAIFAKWDIVCSLKPERAWGKGYSWISPERNGIGFKCNRVMVMTFN